MTWIYLSPHFDDAVYSCGGLIAMQAQSGQRVEIWTVCAGDVPPGPLTPFAEELHARWSAGREAVAVRRAEDEAACRILGAHPRHFTLPDCIYRRLPDGSPLIHANDDLWQPVSAGEAVLVEQVASWLVETQDIASRFAGAETQHIASLRRPGRPRLVCPLTVGGHVDHRLARAAAESLGLRLWYYADYPYSKNAFEVERYLPGGRRGYARRILPVALGLWQFATAAYSTQLSSFWRDEADMRCAITEYAETPAGHSLWRS